MIECDYCELKFISEREMCAHKRYLHMEEIQKCTV